ncbi:MAG: formylglycine-generating enzyme family protein [Planctomycetota bacterium]
MIGVRCRSQEMALLLAAVVFTGASCARGRDSAQTAGSEPSSKQHEPQIVKLDVGGRPIEIVFQPVSVNSGVSAGKLCFISTTEVTWDLYDDFIYGLANEAELARFAADAIARPSKPYVPPDRGFGHAGYPAISMSARGASEFCRWLSVRTGRKFRLPTVDEWQRACLSGISTRYFFGDDPAQLGDYAWYWDNSDDQTHAVAQKKPNKLGLYDMHGNAAEWCVAGDGTFVACGGSFRDDPPDLEVGRVKKPTPAWNAKDPQIPKSQWWLTDAPFVGFRVVMDP